MKITKNERKFYTWIFVIVFVLGLVLMATDNLHWVSASPEWSSNYTVCNKLDCWTGAVSDYPNNEKLDYFLKYRIYTVFTHPRDLTAMLIFAGGLTFIVIITREFFHPNLIKKLNKYLK